MKNKKKNKKVLLLLLLLLGVTIGFAALATTLKINGTTGINSNTWNVYWENKSVNVESVSQATPTLSAETGKTALTIATWNVTLNIPGDFYEFTINAVNAGTIDAMISEAGVVTTYEANNQNTPSTLPEYISYSVTYEDGTAIDAYHLLAKKNGNTPTKEAYKVRVEFTDDISPEQLNAIPEGGYSYTFTTQVQYVQADDNAVNRLGLIDTCPNCTFAHLEYEKYYVDPASTLTGQERDFTKDFTTIKTEYNEQSRSFIGVLLDNSKTITKGYVCGVVDNKPFCIEASTDGSTYTTNINTLRKAFGNSNCYFYELETTLSCSISQDIDGGNDSITLTAETWDDGYVEVYDEFDRCRADSSGTIYCE